MTVVVYSGSILTSVFIQIIEVTTSKVMAKKKWNLRNKFKIVPNFSSLVQIPFLENRDIHTYDPML